MQIEPFDERQRLNTLEWTRGFTFYLAKFDENRFAASHEHCLFDFKAISASVDDEGDTEGYVAFQELHRADGKRGRQYSWVCGKCFHQFQPLMDWKLGVTLPPGPPPGPSWARRPEKRSQAQLEKLVRDSPYALVGWSPEELVAIGSSEGHEISLPGAEELLRENERRIEGAMTRAGHALLVQLLKSSQQDNH